MGRLLQGSRVGCNLAPIVRPGPANMAQLGASSLRLRLPFGAVALIASKRFVVLARSQGPSLRQRALRSGVP